MSTYFWTNVRNPRRNDPDDAGEIAEGYFIVENGWVRLTDAEGCFERGGAERKLNGEDPAKVARALLKLRPGKSDFYRPLKLSDRGIY
jgi:hypothetical protein